MWTGKQVTQGVIALAAVLLIACSPKDKPDGNRADPAVAWWYNMEFTPTATSIHGVDVHTIDADWKRATALDASMLKGRVSEDEIRKFGKSPLSFSVVADVNGDGVPEVIFVGVYEATGGQKGRFVAITQKGKLLQRFKESTTRGFSALQLGDKEVRWYKCMECGEFESIRWGGESFILH
jgi:hypothetical protein